jgi:xanthine/CO dehydrogenase XdhC/CoxF family maturation factor
VSGGCLEADVREVALGLLRDGGSRLLHYDTGSDDETVWGLGLGCEGAVDVFVQSVGPEIARGPAAQALVRMNGHGGFDTAQPFSLVTVIKGPGAGAVSVGPSAAATAVEDRGESAVFVEALQPPPVLCIFGAGDDARPLSSLAQEAGFDVTVIDHRRGYLTPERFPTPARLVLRRSNEGVPPLGGEHYAVVQTHSLQHDREWLRALLQQPLAYLGLLGPRGRREEILKQLGATPEKLFAPVGLDLGAEGPEQVAVSIVSEMLAVRAGRVPAHLRDRQGGIHAD